MIARLILCVAVLWTCHYSSLYAQDKDMTKPPEKQPTPSLDKQAEQKSQDLVRLRTFYLKSGQLVKGRVISEDQNAITLEELQGSRLIVSTYGRRKIASTTIYSKVVPEFEYFIQLGEYFSSRTGDFRDDPDDFIQAIRSYEKAKQLLSTAQSQNSNQIKAIESKIQELQADRQVWIREVQSRAELRELEAQATIDARLTELQEQVSANTKELSALAKADAGDYKALEDAVTDIARTLQELAAEHERLAAGIEDNEDDIDRLWRRSVRPRVYITPDRRTRPRPSPSPRPRPRPDENTPQEQEQLP